MQLLRQSVKFLKLWRNPGREVDVFPDDTFIVSYPRSGNTWTRFLIGNLLSDGEPVSFASIKHRIPDIYYNKAYTLRAIPRPRFLKSHEYFDPRYPKVIYIVRDPRDVAVSYYHYSRKIRWLEDSDPIEGFVEDFVAGKVSTIGSWAENVGSWIGTKANDADRFLLLRYEDLIADTVGELKKSTKFLGINVSDTRINEVIELSTAEQMQESERKTAKWWSVATKNNRPDIPFVRKARSGTWKEELPLVSVNLIESRWFTLMKKLRYLK